MNRMNTICKLKNTIQTYAWGSCTAIPELMGKPTPSKTPQAELWMGAHPKAPSRAFYQNRWVPLTELIEHYPREILGESVMNSFGKNLPYLFKVLAADRPLSIQAHPDRIQAKIGFERENRLQIPMDAFNRNYRDDNHKPECICALTPFWALNGFRPALEILEILEAYFPGGFNMEKKILKYGNSRDGLKAFFQHLMTMDEKSKTSLIDNVVALAEKISSPPPMVEWVIRLHQEYPGDIGLLSPLFLNLICLEPGQAMYLPAGELHAYLRGTAIELMANSDNVLRGGLTGKHIDVPELINILTFNSRRINCLTPRAISPSEGVYDSISEEFMLSRIRVDEKIVHESGLNRSVEILLCTEGRALISPLEAFEEISVARGDSVLVPAAVKKYSIKGDAVFYKAFVPKTFR